MARIHGRNGQLYVGIASSAAAAEPFPFASKWMLNFTTDRTEVTAFGDGNKVYVAGLPDTSGTFEGYFDDSTAQAFTAASDGEPRKCYFYPTTPSTAGPYWYGTAFFDFTVETDVAGVVSVNGNISAASDFTKIG